MNRRSAEMFVQYAEAMKAVADLCHRRSKLIDDAVRTFSELDASPGFRNTPSKEVLEDIRSSLVDLVAVNSNERDILMDMASRVGLK